MRSVSKPIHGGRGGLQSTEVANLLLTQQFQVRFPSSIILKNNSEEKLSMLLRLINSAG